mmetsp:Transcript_45511/g.134730  ORF Transcript_45511/g.134730 Transcript_45511/m.134730 type:complete len:100 (-) Transcript_45511:306-605(-)
MSAVLWDKLHIYHNPMTGSYHSPPTSGLLDWDDHDQAPVSQRVDSSPPCLFPFERVPSSERCTSPKRQARQVAGCPSAHMFCGFCLSSLTLSSEREEEK